MSIGRICLREEYCFFRQFIKKSSQNGKREEIVHKEHQAVQVLAVLDLTGNAVWIDNELAGDYTQEQMGFLLAVSARSRGLRRRECIIFYLR